MSTTRISLKLIALGAAAALLHGAATIVCVSMPARWVYTVDDACQWQRRPWARMVGADTLPGLLQGGRDMLQGCYQRRGLWSTTPFLKMIVSKWPSQAELAAAVSRQEPTEDAHEIPLPAIVQTRAGDVRSNDPG